MPLEKANLNDHEIIQQNNKISVNLTYAFPNNSYLGKNLNCPQNFKKAF